MNDDRVMTMPRTGTFCWPELGTTDTDAARKFYGGLFGWDFFDDPGPAGNYIHARLGGREVGAIRALGAPGEAPDMPAFWNNYVSVVSTDDTLKSVTAAGGRVMMGPYDAGESGRMAVVQDPAGAVFAVWQAKKHLGAAVTGEPGSLGWMQLNTKDLARTEAFYTHVFGWGVRRDAMAEGGDYLTFSVAGVPFAGSMALPPGLDAPSHWLTYFTVADVDAAHARAASLGATTYVPPMDIPGIARFAVLADPQGATFAIIRFTR